MSEYHPVCKECLLEVGFESEDLCVGFSSANCETCGCQRFRRDLVCLDTDSFRRYKRRRELNREVSLACEPDGGRRKAQEIYAKYQKEMREVAKRRVVDSGWDKEWAAFKAGITTTRPPEQPNLPTAEEMEGLAKEGLSVTETWKDECALMWDKGSDAGDATTYIYASTRPVVQEIVPTSEDLERLIQVMMERPAVQTGAFFLPEPGFSAFMGHIRHEPISFDLPDPAVPYKFVYPFDYGVKVYRMPSALLMPCDTGSPVVDDCEEKPRPVRQERPAPAHHPMWQNVVLAAVAALVMCMLVQALEM